MRRIIANRLIKLSGGFVGRGTARGEQGHKKLQHFGTPGERRINININTFSIYINITFGLLRSSLKSRPHGVVRCSLVPAGTCVGIALVGAACHAHASGCAV